MTDTLDISVAKETDRDVCHRGQSKSILSRESCDKMLLPPWFMMDSGSSRLMTHFKNKNRRKTSAKVSPSSSTTFSIWIEDGKELPIFWNGENAVTSIRWTPTHDSEQNKLHNFETIQDFLSFYAPEKYVKNCSMSLQVSRKKYINNLKLSDPILSVLDQTNNGRPCTLLLSQADHTESEGGYSKFLLHIREMDGKKVLWNGKIPTNRIVAKLNQSDMGLSIKDCLKNYLAGGYLSQNCQIDLVKEKNDGLRSSKDELIPVAKDETVSTIFKGNSASLVIRNFSNSYPYNFAGERATKEALSTEAPDKADASERSNEPTDIPVFQVPPAQCDWIGKTWEDISQEIRSLVHSVEQTVRDTILPGDVYFSVYEKKRRLELANRKRSNSVDEIWRQFVALSIAHNQILNNDLYVEPSRQTCVQLVGNRVDCSDSVHFVGRRLSESMLNPDTSYLESLSSCMIKYGMELGLYDEEMEAARRYAGLGVGIAVAIAICAIIYYS